MTADRDRRVERENAAAARPDGTSGDLTVVDIGPGSHADMTVRAQEALLDADVIVGDRGRLDDVPVEIRDRVDEEYATDSDSPTEAARAAVDRAAAGRRVALIPAQGSAVNAAVARVFDAVGGDGGRSEEDEPPTVEVVPGVSAADSAAARFGAPLGDAVATVALSGRQSSPEAVETRLRAVTDAGFGVVLTEPRWPARRPVFERACAVLEANRDGDAPVGLAQPTDRGWRRTVARLDELRAYGETELVDASTTILVTPPGAETRNGWLVTQTDS
ncbi:SAM-dependent methyltransferase [Halobaculum sp. D14]|uniref:SAM-dependent methyltransferase n=1 Tax=Halobaculum sp. D14 TaxID=3421642 RepID=UPI003EC0FEA0